MKKTVIAMLFLAIVLCNNLVAQEADNSNCFMKWAVLFEKRGAHPVVDGTYEDVILTFRANEEANCYTGKVVVINGVVTKMFLKRMDGSYERVEKQYKYDTEAKIQNGITITRVTEDGELINVIFPDKLKPKASPYQAAPMPADMDVDG